MKWVFANAHESLPIEPWIELKSKRQKKANSIETIYTKLVQFAGSPRAWGRSARGTCNSIVIEQSEAWLIWTLRTRTHTCTHTHTPNKGQCHLSQCCSFDTSQLLSELQLELHPSILKRVFCYLSLYLYSCTCTCLCVCVPVAACDSVCPVANALAPFLWPRDAPIYSVSSSPFIRSPAPLACGYNQLGFLAKFLHSFRDFVQFPLTNARSTHSNIQSFTRSTFWHTQIVGNSEKYPNLCGGVLCPGLNNILNPIQVWVHITRIGQRNWYNLRIKIPCSVLQLCSWLPCFNTLTKLTDL